MTSLNPDKHEEIAAALRQFHRNACYPEAMDFEIDAVITAIIKALGHC